MLKTCLSLAAVSLFAAVTQAEIAQPVIQRDAKGLVTITAAPGAVIYYTLDNSEPDQRGSGGVYLAPIQAPFKAVVKARAYDNSPVAAVTFETEGNVSTPPSAVIPVTQNRNWSSYDWVKRHNSLCALVRERKPALIFIGDSITHFMEGKDVWHKYYEPRNAVDLGFGWDRTENVLWRLQHGELDGYEPKVAVVMIGTNNGNPPAEIATGIRAICAEIHQRTPKTKILLLGVFPRGEKPDGGRTKIEEINKLIAAFDGQDGITFLDIGSKFLNSDGTISKEIMGDFLHPTPKGYEIWAEAMEPTLKTLLGE